MESFQYTCLSIADVCEHNDLDLAEVMDAVCASDVSFGCNGDTLISTETFENILEDDGFDTNGINYGKYGRNTIMISLGS